MKTPKNYKIDAGNSMVDAMRSLAEHEIEFSKTVTFSSLVDLSAIENIRSKMGTDRPSYTAIVCKALALTLQEFPYANQRITNRFLPFFFGTRRQQFSNVDITVMVERDEPQAPNVSFVDTMRDVEKLSLAEIGAQLRKLSQATTETNEQWKTFRRILSIRPGWLGRLILMIPWFSAALWVKYRGGAASVSAPAKYGVDSLVTSWPSPIGVSFGLVKKRPLVKDDIVVARPTFHLVLNWDRRIMAGAQAARFFARLVKHLEDPSAIRLGDSLVGQALNKGAAESAHAAFRQET